jgi:chromosome segregation ATPase
MTYFKKNVNLLLLLAIVLILGSLIGLTTYYQSTYRNISYSYGQTVEQVNMLAKNLTLQKTELNRTLSQLEIKSEDKTKLDQLYTDLSSENERLNSELTGALEELSNKKADLVIAENNLLSAQHEISIKNAEIARYLNEINDLEDEIDDLEDQLCKYNSTAC